jgi:hypothetical protein
MKFPSEQSVRVLLKRLAHRAGRLLRESELNRTLEKSGGQRLRLRLGTAHAAVTAVDRPS